jgi:uncharacterized phage-associated protein
MEHYDVKKIANTIIFFIDNDVKNLGITKLMKLFFYADKYHLEEYGKPIFNHNYTKLPRGPVPTWLYSIIRTAVSGSIDFDFKSEVDIFNNYIEAKEVNNGEYMQVFFNKKQGFDKNFFSKSQINILSRIIDEFKYITATDISEKSHATKAWQSVEQNQQITYSLMVDDDCVSEYINFIQTEKRSFSKNFQKHKLKKAC